MEKYSLRLADLGGKFYALQSVVHVDDLEGFG
jgi:hypothetical protein